MQHQAVEGRRAVPDRRIGELEGTPTERAAWTGGLAIGEPAYGGADEQRRLRAGSDRRGGRLERGLACSDDGDAPTCIPGPVVRDREVNSRVFLAERLREAIGHGRERPDARRDHDLGRAPLGVGRPHAEIPVVGGRDRGDGSRDLLSAVAVAKPARVGDELGHGHRLVRGHVR